MSARLVVHKAFSHCWVVSQLSGTPWDKVIPYLLLPPCVPELVFKILYFRSVLYDHSELQQGGAGHPACVRHHQQVELRRHGPVGEGGGGACPRHPQGPCWKQAAPGLQQTGKLEKLSSELRTTYSALRWSKKTLSGTQRGTTWGSTKCPRL